MFQGVDNGGSMMSWKDNNGRSSRRNIGDGSDLQSSRELISSKRIKLSHKYNQQIFEGIDSSQESSPLGLTLTKTPSFENQIEMELFQKRQIRDHPLEANHGLDDTKCISKMGNFVSQQMYEKLKASNFPATLLKIGNWERISRREGDLVAKCYYAKRKLVWEFLEGALKSKIELQWSDIIAIRAIIDNNAHGVLEVELNQPPLFFRETNPQPRKHTLWQQVSDFTRGQASIWRRHYVRFPPGMLDKHYEKLLHCDQRLCLLSRRHFPSQNSPYFESNGYGFSFNGYGLENPHGLQYPHQICPTALVPSHVHNFKQATQYRRRFMDLGSPMSVMDFVHMNDATNALWDQGSNCFTNVANHNYVESLSSITSETQANLLSRGHVLNYVGAIDQPNADTIQQANSLSRGQDYHHVRNYTEAVDQSNADTIQQANSLSRSQDYHHVLNYAEVIGQPNEDTIQLNEIKYHLLGDSQVVCSDEKKLIEKVNSMCSLLDLSEYGRKINEGQDTLSGGVPYSEVIDRLHPQSSNESSMMQSSINNSLSPYA